jgi:uncharacterized glyoxalase superfamily protein PhnB
MRNHSAPPATVTPVLAYPDVRSAVEWLASALGFEERVRIGEGHRAQLSVGGDGCIVVAEAHERQTPSDAGYLPQVIKVRVADVDAAFARACAAGAVVDQEPETFEYGERSCVVADPVGYRWELTQSVRDVKPEEWGGSTVSSW